MIDKNNMINFFNKCASSWDADTIKDEKITTTIFDNGGIRPGVAVLDVACGTGVLFPDYLSRNVKSVTGVDISPEMIRIAKGKFQDHRISILCADIKTVELGQHFDCCMVYNALPHFPDPQNLIRVLASHLKPDGRLSVAHGMSRAALQRHHSGAASKVSIELPSETELAQMFAPYFDVDVMISDDKMYQVSGIKKL